MVQLTLNFDLQADKLNEFNQSWESFTQHPEKFRGLVVVKKSVKANSCEIVMEWKEQSNLDSFLHCEWYEFLSGAITVLSDEKVFHQKQIEHE